MDVKGLIFDLDGVIVNTEKNHYDSWKKIAETLGVDYDLDFNENLKGVSRSKSLELILKKGNMTIEDSKFEEYLELKNSFYMKSIEGLSTSDILPGVVSTIQKAKKLGLFCIIGSSSKNSRLILDKVGLLDAFDFIVDGNDLKSPKPHPEVFLKGAKLAKLNPKECIVFEDAASGVEAAKKGGFKVIAVGNSHIKDLADAYLETLETFQFA